MSGGEVFQNIALLLLQRGHHRHHTLDKARTVSSLCVPKLPLRHCTPGRIARLQSMEGSLPPPLLQNRACHFCGTRLLSDAPSVIGICPTVHDNRADLWSDVSRLSLAGHRSLTPQHGSSASPALLLPITCTSPSSRQHIRGIALGLRFLRNPSPSALRLAPAPVLCRAGEHGWGYFVPDPSLAMNVGWSTLPDVCGGECQPCGKRLAQTPVPFGSSVSACFRWFNLTTVS